MSKHTPEPWISRGMGGDSIILASSHRFHTAYPGTWNNQEMYPIAVPRIFNDRDRGTFWDSSAGFSHDDARRIVVCVNACTGIPTSALSEGYVGELVKALQHIAWEPLTDDMGASSEQCFEEAVRIAKAALAPFTKERSDQ